MNWLQVILTVVTIGSIFSVVTLALNLQYARGGMINFGVVAYFAAGAYIYAIFTHPAPEGLDQYIIGLDWPWWAGFIAAGIASLLFAVLTGWPTLRLRGEYLAVTTFAFAEVLYSFLLNERRIGNGAVGLSNIERPIRDWGTIDEKYIFAIVAVALMFLTAWIFRKLLNSPYGRALDAIRDDEGAAQAIGKSAKRMRLQVFLLSAIPIGFAGALYAMYMTLVSPRLFTAEVSFIVWIALVLGGERTIWGAMAGTFGLILLEEVITSLPFESVSAAQNAAAMNHVVTGLLFIAVLRWQPFEWISKKLEKK
ncbi:branched-chain amino acid ABC transporter permease [Desulforhopalus singaporensis]|uniref:Amino acid/amide ABC transporter membrane protein 2, HAAT family n=1 Tax=Desulforhopalus singaporensis TaxID=91360 RepID=A0A1H0VB53_9BACT|nr:branched-chain amino acid ABC transporter permease [Desulforhopalus singaporensis]SDP75789.1 amino acid/amide ABC transporter membrane protein 2, HAAT family [Desulforhopalus singaporensis]